jgi:tetratricopeptide (TPR) repeat protein
MRTKRHRPQRPGSKGAWFRTHWRGVTAALLASGGTPAGVIAGLASTNHRAIWLTGAGVCAGLAAMISLLPGRHATSQTLGDADVQATNAVQITAVLNTQPETTSSEDMRRWTIPSPVRSFTGRRQTLITLREQLTRGGTAALVPLTALHGMGGVGKTQLALAYAHHHRKDYRLGWWIPADNELSITNSLAELAVALGMSSGLGPRELANQAREALAGQDGWLLIFDNASDPISVAGYLPAAGRGHVLITSRSPVWQGIADPLQVDVLALDDAVELLQVRSGDSDRQAAEALAIELGRLPLALEQAAAYAGQHLAGSPRPLRRYLALFRERHRELWAKVQPLAYSGTVDATFTLALDRLRESNRPAVTLLEMFALLAADEIPVHLMLSQPEHLPTRLADAAYDPMDSGEMVAALFQAGLLTLDSSGTATMHRIIQIVALDRLSTSERRQRVEQTVNLLASLFPDEGWEPDQQATCAQLLPHAQSVLDHVAAQQLATPAVAQLLTTVGVYLSASRLELSEACDIHQQALAMNQSLYVGDNPAIARSLSDVARDLRRLGEVDQALGLDVKALQMLRRLYRDDHPAIASSLVALAANKRLLGMVDQARELDTQGLEMRRRLYRGDHLELSRSLYSLAMDLRALEQVDLARELDVQALEMRRRLYQSDHPAVAYAICNLALDLHLLGELQKAQELNSKALAMHRRLHNDDHLDVATNLNNLANDLYLLGELKQAQKLDKQALAIRRRLYADDHPVVAESLGNLAADLRALGDGEAARRLTTEASEMRQRLREVDPSDARSVRSGLPDVAVFVLANGRRARALDD